MGKIYNARREDEIGHDRRAVAVVFDSCIVGHLRRTSRLFKNSMTILQHRGEDLMRDY